MNRIASEEGVDFSARPTSSVSVSAPSSAPSSERWWDWSLWLRWVLANAAGEVLGLGLAGAVTASMVVFIGEPASAVMAVLMAFITILCGTFEGGIVGYAQWRVLRRCLPRMSRQKWVVATAIGAMAAWMLGMLPNTLMAINQDAQGSTASEINDALMYTLAAGMGAALGIVLGIPQWRALRHHVAHAGWWVWANSAAWVVGMPLVFIGAGSSPQNSSLVRIVLTGIGTIAAAGAVVGAIHGAALLWLLRSCSRVTVKYEAG